MDTLTIEFNNHGCEIALINYWDPNELEEEQIQKEENKFIRILYNIMYTHYQLQQPIEFDLFIGCESGRVKNVQYPSDLFIGCQSGRVENVQYPSNNDDDYEDIQPNEDIGSYQLRTNVLPAMRTLFIEDHDDDCEDWTHGRRTFRMTDYVDEVQGVINWNHPLPDAAAAAYALGKKGGGVVPKDLIQYALEWDRGNYAERFEREPAEQWYVYDSAKSIIEEVIEGRGIEVLALTRSPVCRQLMSDIEEAFGFGCGGFTFTYMGESMTPAQVDAVRAHVATRYGHHTVPIVFNNGSFIGGSEAM